MTVPVRSAAGLSLVVGVLLAMGTAAEPPRRSPALQPPAENAIDVVPGPAREAPPEDVRAASALPAAAQSSAWRAGARPPGDVPAGVIVRAALRGSGAGKLQDGRRAGEPSVAIEIVWNAPGT